MCSHDLFAIHGVWIIYDRSNPKSNTTTATVESLECCLHNLVSCEFYSWTMGQVLLGKCLESLHGVIE